MAAKTPLSVDLTPPRQRSARLRESTAVGLMQPGSGRLHSISRRFSNQMDTNSPRNSLAGGMASPSRRFTSRFSGEDNENPDTDTLNVASYVGFAFFSAAFDRLVECHATDANNISTVCPVQVPSRVIRFFENVVAAGDPPPESELVQPISSILLVADISGFTKLSKFLLETKGKDGPDLTSQYVFSLTQRQLFS